MLSNKQSFLKLERELYLPSSAGCGAAWAAAKGGTAAAAGPADTKMINLDVINKQAFLKLERELYLPPWGCRGGALIGNGAGTINIDQVVM